MDSRRRKEKNKKVTIISYIFACLVTLPILTWFILNFILNYLLKNKRRAFRISTDVSTFFAIIDVYLLINQIWSISLMWLLVLFVLLSGVAFTFIYWRGQHEFDSKKIIRSVWRFNFLIFMTASLVLLFYGLVEGLLRT